ncbi:MAG: proliferating cell nuclear antigen (pcna) [Candidatus Thermoplasmatota archaeon]|nr:proliferating cell nuclear antigen (pcna) [Candidatus Thermoplasmatota archaeon]MDI6856588.1 proliferating cell nuclear antigen (pcna) [Candidatus Thermoplasmatota archaeon]
MFEATVKCEVLKEVVNVISTLVNEAKFSIDSKGLTVRAVDPAHVAMVDLELKAGAFEKYKADETELGIDLEKLGEVLKLASATDKISLQFDEERNKLVVKVENITRRMPLVDVASMSEPKVPNLNPTVKVVLKTSELDKGIKAGETVSDHIALVATPEGFEVTSESETDFASLKLSKASLEALQCKELTKSLYSSDYFSKMIKAITSSEKVMLWLGNDYPVKLEFELANGHGKAYYLLAPRIESE